MWFGAAQAKCESMDSVRAHASQLMDALEAVAAQAVETKNDQTCREAVALAEYLAERLQGFVMDNDIGGD